MERYGQGKTGILEVICGPMFSGKTEELIRRLRRAQIARQRVLVFKPSIDDRYDATQIVSHSDQRIPSVAVTDVAAMRRFWEQNGEGIDVVGVDECQFFDESLVMWVDKLACDGVRVVVAGLDQDYLGAPFGQIPQLLAMADLITKQYAVCMKCGAPASKSQRVRREGADLEQLVLVGAAEQYEARCRACHVKGIDTHATHG